jgi:hypothetical protein
LGVASEDFAFESGFKEYFLLFFRAEVIERGHKHVKMEGEWHLFGEKELFSELVVVIEW